MNCLILSWRDPKNPKSGGAEKLNMQILKPLIERGDQVTWYAMAVKGLPRKENYNGIKIIRVGNTFTNLLFWPFLYWSGKLGKADLIIDSIHGTGYLSSLFAPGVKKIILICEVAQNIWDEMYAFPVNKIGQLWEKIMFNFYKRSTFWTISESTKKDLMTFGIAGNNISVLPMGFDKVNIPKNILKSQQPSALFVGRLAEMKGIKDAIKAITQVNKSSVPKWSLRIIGRGEEQYESELRALVSRLGMDKHIQFLGFVDEKSKFEEMAKAWVLVVPSSREGWGMIVPEANSVGTGVIGYGVPGLRDVLKAYAKENITIPPLEEHLVESISKITKPLEVSEKITSGWKDLHAFVLNHI